ncbi:hypothetical protein MJI37_32650, partial [Salmonella enterica subsp. enterica serovar Cerro]|nr:hypothetical protein [Salmonella enterica subsp. enterica serovar Cerro]
MHFPFDSSRQQYLQRAAHNRHLFGFGGAKAPTFDTIEAQASYGIGLQVGQQLSESGLEGLLPEALVAGIADA